MITDHLKTNGMKEIGERTGFTVLAHLSWTGLIIVGNPGASYSPEICELCPELELGSVAMIFDSSTGTLIKACADQGDQKYPSPKADEQLVIATARPVNFTPRALDTIASLLNGENETGDLSEAHLANVQYFVARLQELGLSR